ncbi:protein LEAD-SENSITIVE [Trifolium repens]|nr:protein LEAD-SENSITIVE [Trifolium repens]
MDAKSNIQLFSLAISCIFSTGTFFASLSTSCRNQISETNLLMQYVPKPTNVTPQKLVVTNRTDKEAMELAAAEQDPACPLPPRLIFVVTRRPVLQ